LLRSEFVPQNQKYQKNFDKIEAQLLEDFYDFIRQHPGNLWLHWNMINLQFGFETLAHRYGVLTGKNAPSIEMDSRINIAGIVSGKYGANYADVPHMPKRLFGNRT
jgi:hypothetical protein